MKVAVTGANGKVGPHLIRNLPFHPFEVKALDLPSFDATDFGQFVDATEQMDAIIHLAWQGLPDVDHIYPENADMYRNAFRSAVVNNIGLVIVGSSNQARDYSQREEDGHIRHTGQPETPINAYGRDKQAMEAMGQEYARKHGLAVVCLRIGNVNDEDKPNPEHNPSRWLSQRDLGQLVGKILQTNLPPGYFGVFYGVSDQDVFDWANPFGYEPQDKS